MLGVTLVCIGRLKDKFFEEASAEYLKRLKAYAKVNIFEIKAVELPEEPSSALIAAALEKEGNEIIKKIPANAKVVALCIEGKEYSSEETARLLSETALSGCSEIAFVIGGSYGLADSVKQRADVKLSMSRMTFPHRLARIMLLEQIYRGFKINAGEKYHK